jgi:hypothetical protein
MEFTKKDVKVAKFVRHFTSYNGRKSVKVRSSKSYHVSDYWSDGSRTECVFVDFVSGEYLSDSAAGFVRQVTANPFGLRMGTAELRPGVSVVELSTFAGKTLGIRVVLHPEDYERFGSKL